MACCDCSVASKKNEKRNALTALACRVGRVSLSFSAMDTPHQRRSLWSYVSLIVISAALAGVVGFYAGRRAGAHNVGTGNPLSSREVIKLIPTTPSTTSHYLGEKNRNSWQEFLRTPAAARRNEAMAAWLEQLATTDSERAMQLAQAESNRLLREQLLVAALRGWARGAPDAAAGWALAQGEPSFRANALRAVFAGAVERPDEAVRLGRVVFERDPEGATEHGVALIDALVDAGHYAIASRVASESNPARPVWVIEAYAKWSALQPDEAARAAAASPEGEIRTNAMRGMANGWGEVDPGGLSQFLTTLPASETRRELLGHSLRQWVTTDPVSASKWINGVELGPDMDEGVAAVATMASLKPEVATSWAESIESPQLRSETLATVLREWGRTDPKAAAQYLTTTKDLQADERQMLAEFFRNNLNIAVP